MNHAKDLIGAFMEHYSTAMKRSQYSRRMAEDIVDKYAWIGPKYKVALYDEVVREFVPTQTRPLPDIAALTKGEKALPDPQTFVDHTKALPEPEGGFDPKAWEMSNYTLEDARQKEIRRVTDRVAHRNVRPSELHWLWCMEKNNGVYIPPSEGPYADEFKPRLARAGDQR